MNDVYMAFTAAFFIPLLFHSWRVALLGLAVQGMLLAMVPASHVHEWSNQIAVECGLLFILRGVVAPWLLYRYAITHQGELPFALIGKNIYEWAIAAVLLVGAFLLGDRLAPHDAHEALQVGTAAGCILIGMFVLSRQNARFGQAVGLLTIESGMALVELLSPHAMPIPVSIGVNVVYVTLLITMGLYLRSSSVAAAGSEAPAIKGEA